MRLVYENVARLELEIAGDAAIRVVDYERLPEREDGHAPSAPSVASDMCRSDCVAFSLGTTEPTQVSPEREPATVAATGQRPYHAALRRYWRWQRFSLRVEGLLAHMAASPVTGPTVEAGEAWIVAVVRDTRRRRDQRLAHLVAAFTAMGGTPQPERSSPMERLNPPDPNIDRLMRLLRRDPTGGQLRGLSDFEAELGAERVGVELEALIAAGVAAGPSPMGAVVERLRQVCQERRTQRRAEQAVFGAAGRPLEHDADQYEARVRRDECTPEVAHG